MGEIPRKRLVRHQFTADEDRLLRGLVETLGQRDWMTVADFMPGRSSRQCKERWVHYLAPNIIVDDWSIEEDTLLLEKVEELGRKWRQIEPFFAGRPDISLKNRYNVLQRRERKRLRRSSGICLEVKAENPRTTDELLAEDAAEPHIEWQYDAVTYVSEEPLDWSDAIWPDWFCA